MLVIPKTLKIDNFRTTSSNSINLDTIRKLMEYSLRKIFVKAIFTLTIFEILLIECRSVSHQSRGAKRGKKVKQ